MLKARHSDLTPYYFAGIFSVSKHHCRRCGRVVCEKCCTKAVEMRIWLVPPPHNAGGHDWRVAKQTVCDECAEPEFHYEPRRAAPKFKTPPEPVPIHACSSSSSQFRADLVWEHDDFAAGASSHSCSEEATVVECDARRKIAHEVGSWA